MGRQPSKMAGLEMGAHQYGCAIYQLPHTHSQIEKAESAWLGMPRHPNTACGLPENEKSSLHVEKPKCRLLFKGNKMLKPMKLLKIILAAILLPAAALWLYAGYLKMSDPLPTGILHQNFNALETVGDIPRHRFTVLDAKEFAAYSETHGDVRGLHRRDDRMVFFDKQNTVTAVSCKRVYRYGDTVLWSQTVYRSANDATAVALPWPLAQ